MRLEKQIPRRNPPRAPVAREGDNSIALSTAQILQIAGILDPTAEDELVAARSAWISYQSTRERNAVYRYLSAVFEIVMGWKKQHHAEAKSRQVLARTKLRRTIRIEEPFSIVIFCTSDPCKVDVKTRNKWSRALRYTERFKPDNQSLAAFIKGKGSINKCAAQWSGHLR